MMENGKGKSMTRILYTLVICALLLIAIVWQAPSQFAERIGLYPSSRPTHTAVEGATPAVPRRAQPRPVKVSAPVVKVSMPVAESAVEPEEPKVEPSSVEKVNPAIVSIDSEEPLSLRNSPRGSVIGRVQKGERVERQFEMYEAGEKWVFVKVSAQNLAGFLESDRLEPPKNPAH